MLRDDSRSESRLSRATFKTRHRPTRILRPLRARGPAQGQPSHPRLHAVGKSVSKFAAAFSQSVEMGALLEGLGHTIHAYQPLSKAVQEAALRSLRHMMHN